MKVQQPKFSFTIGDSTVKIDSGNHPIVCKDCVIGRGAYQPQVSFRPTEMSISVDVDVPPLRDSFPTLFVGEPRFDVVVKDDSGRELHLPNARIVARLHTLGRIPRNMKKALKKKHGVYWKQHHPNVERFYSISNKD